MKVASLSRRVDQLKEQPVDAAKAAHRVIMVGTPRKHRKENLPTRRRYAAPSRERADSILRHISGHISNADKMAITPGSKAACI
jgi:predicted ATPase